MIGLNHFAGFLVQGNSANKAIKNGNNRSSNEPGTLLGNKYKSTALPNPTHIEKIGAHRANSNPASRINNNGPKAAPNATQANNTLSKICWGTSVASASEVNTKITMLTLETKRTEIIRRSPLLDSLLTYLLKALGCTGVVTSGIERRAHVKVARATLWFELLNAVGVLQGQVVHA